MNECSEVVQKSRVATYFLILYLVLFLNQWRLHASYSCVNKAGPERAFACANSSNWEYVNYTLSQASEDRNFVTRHSVKASERRKHGQRKLSGKLKMPATSRAVWVSLRSAGPGSVGLSETLWSTWLPKHYFCTYHISAHLICSQIASSFCKKEKEPYDLYFLDEL